MSNGGNNISDNDPPYHSVHRRLCDNIGIVLRWHHNRPPISLTHFSPNFLYRPAQTEQNVTSNSNIGNREGSFVINVDNPDDNIAQENNAQNVPNHNVDNNAAPNNVDNNDSNNTQGNDRAANPTEVQQFLLILQKYVPFILIILTKALYDHNEGILNFIVLFAAFIFANTVVKREATKRARRDLKSLLLPSLYIILSVVYIYVYKYLYEDDHSFLNLIFIPTFVKPLNLYELLWMVIVTDFVLKLVTILIKLGLTALPDWLVGFPKRVRNY